MDYRSVSVIGLHQKGANAYKEWQAWEGAREGDAAIGRHAVTYALFILLLTITSPRGACQFSRGLIIAFLHAVLSAHGVLSMPDVVTMSEITLLISMSFAFFSFPASLAVSRLQTVYF